MHAKVLYQSLNIQYRENLIEIGKAMRERRARNRVNHDRNPGALEERWNFAN